MATNEGCRKDAMFMVVGICPDVCKSPSTPVPYPIVAYCNTAVAHSANVRFRGKWAFHEGSRLSTVVGDEAGVGGGVVSGVNKGFCRPVGAQLHSTTVRVNGQFVDYHAGTLMHMNCAGPEGPGNTIGIVIYTGAMIPGPVGPGGTIPASANSIVAPETPGEVGCMPVLGDLAGSFGGGLDDMVGLAQQAYALATTDWSNPASVLGAIGGLAGIAGMGDLAQVAGIASKGYNLATTDWDNPGEALAAVAGVAVPAQSGNGNSTSFDEGPFGILGKIWTLPNTVLGVALGATGAAAQEAWYLLGQTEIEPGIGFGHNGIEFTNSPFVDEETALTLGNAIIYSPENGPKSSGKHEQAHTHQAQLLGPLYLPAYALGMIGAGLQGHYPFGEANYMEQGPHNGNRPWPEGSILDSLGKLVTADGASPAAPASSIVAGGCKSPAHSPVASASSGDAGTDGILVTRAAPIVGASGEVAADVISGKRSGRWNTNRPEREPIAYRDGPDGTKIPVYSTDLGVPDTSESLGGAYGVDDEGPYILVNDRLREAQQLEEIEHEITHAAQDYEKGGWYDYFFGERYDGNAGDPYQNEIAARESEIETIKQNRDQYATENEFQERLRKEQDTLDALKSGRPTNFDDLATIERYKAQRDRWLEKHGNSEESAAAAERNRNREANTERIEQEAAKRDQERQEREAERRRQEAEDRRKMDEEWDEIERDASGK